VKLATNILIVSENCCKGF